tara:strand:+ start:286 stop:798 length:513 start_codon:yes stop_codon:yes gene_type:complete
VIKPGILESQASHIYIAIGSNLGNKKLNIEKAKFFLTENGVKSINISKYYETPSWPNPSRPKFLNIVLKTKCYLKPVELLKICKSIEVKLGRKKDIKNSPRVCDIDIIDYKGLTFKTGLILPHKSMYCRNFVLFPLFEIEKQWFHPVLNVDIKKLIFSLPNKDIRSIKQI